MSSCPKYYIYFTKNLKRNYKHYSLWLATERFVDEIKTAKFFTILADEVESHHIEQLPLCVRFVADKKNIREEFFEFGKCTRVPGEAVANQIIYIIEKAGFDIKDCRGQVCDGASSVYTHCCGHNLSLVVVSACKLPVIRNVLDKVQQITQMFIKGSKK